jgi:hypothetical protein
MKWCPLINMFCDDLDEEDISYVQDIYSCCDGDCRHCSEVEYVNK